MSDPPFRARDLIAADTSTEFRGLGLSSPGQRATVAATRRLCEALGLDWVALVRRVVAGESAEDVIADELRAKDLEESVARRIYVCEPDEGGFRGITTLFHDDRERSR